MYTDLTNLCVAPNSLLGDAVAKMDVSRTGIVLVVDEERRLLGTVTDGDVCRAILSNIGMQESISTLLARKEGSQFGRPVTAPRDADPSAMLEILQRHSILHLPLVDQDQHVVALVKLDEFVAHPVSMPQAVIMAGGSGSRLRPLTDDLPKPMLPIGDRPLMELTIQQLRQVGIKHVNLTTHYQKDAIFKHFH